MDTEKCKYFQDNSPENPVCAWCVYFNINLDNDNRICHRCKNDKKFRDRLMLLRTVRFEPDCEGEKSWCDIFGIPTNPENCSLCKENPEHRQFLFSQRMSRKMTRENHDALRECKYRGEEIRTEKRVCCGGRKKTIAIYKCEKKVEASEVECRTCSFHER